MNIEKQGVERTIYTPTKPVATLLLAHGAGAGNENDFMVMLATELCKLDCRVVSFNFPYMQKMYSEGKRKPPNKQQVLIEHFESEIALAKTYQQPLFIAGKSMGGRIASMINHASTASTDVIQAEINGCIVFGYPFIPPGKPEKFGERTEHLQNQQTPLVICQGERDNFGNKTFISEQAIASILEIKWIADGDHSFKPRKSSGTTLESNISNAADITISFISNRL